MTVISHPMPESRMMITVPLSTVCVDAESPLIQPAGPDCGFMIQAVTMVATMPPTMIAQICWSLNRFFIASSR